MAECGSGLKPLLGHDLVSEKCSFSYLIETARNWAEKLPATDELRDVVDQFQIAVTEKCPRDAVLMLCGILVDGFPNARPASMEGYLVALSTVSTDRGFSHHVIGAAIKAVWCDVERAFPPSPGEFLQAVQEAHQRFAWALARASHLIAMRESAQLVLEAYGKGSELKLARSFTRAS
jgi:hypothetical protein